MRLHITARGRRASGDHAMAKIGHGATTSVRDLRLELPFARTDTLWHLHEFARTLPHDRALHAVRANEIARARAACARNCVKIACCAGLRRLVSCRNAARASTVATLVR